MDVTRWNEDLEEDLEVLNALWGKVVDVRGDKDEKLQRLLALIDEKAANLQPEQRQSNRLHGVR